MSDDTRGLMLFVVFAIALWWGIANYDLVPQKKHSSALDKMTENRFQITHVDYVGTMLLDTATGQTWQFRKLVGENGKELEDAQSRYWEKMVWFNEDKFSENEWVRTQFELQELVDKSEKQ